MEPRRHSATARSVAGKAQGSGRLYPILEAIQPYTPAANPAAAGVLYPQIAHVPLRGHLLPGRRQSSSQQHHTNGVPGGPHGGGGAAGLPRTPYRDAPRSSPSTRRLNPYPRPAPGRAGGGPRVGSRPQAGSGAGGPHAGGPHAGGPHAGGPHAEGPHAEGPHAGGPHAGGPHAGGHQTGGSPLSARRASWGEDPRVRLKPGPALYELYNSRRSFVLGLLHILVGLVTIATNVLGLMLIPVHNLEDNFFHYGYGFWSAMLYILAGSFAISAGSMKTRCHVIASLALSTLASLTACVHVAMATVSMARSAKMDDDLFEESATSHIHLSPSHHPYMKVTFVLSCTMLALGLAGFILATSESCLGCQATCSSQPAMRIHYVTSEWADYAPATSHGSMYGDGQQGVAYPARPRRSQALSGVPPPSYDSIHAPFYQLPWPTGCTRF